MSTDRVDWNDLHVECGLDEVRRQLLAGIAAFEARSVVEGGGQVEDDVAPPVPPDTAYEDDLAAQDHQYSPSDHAWFDRLTRNRENKIESHVGNLDLVFANDPRWEGVLAYCDFSYRVLFLRKAPIDHAEVELQDPDVARMRVWFQRNYLSMRPPPRNELQDAIIIASQRQRHHPVRTYLESLRPPGQKLIDDWLIRAFDAAGNRDYLRMIGRRFLIGAVARVMRPGCKMDNMLILEGNQGIYKSTALSILFGDWFSDAPIPLGDKDAYQLIQGVWGYEMAELDALSKTESTTAKAFITQQNDRFRPPYGTGVMSFKRQTVFVGTTNQDEYLKDYSGNRRYWPVLCRHVDLEWMELNRDQLWAEAVAAYRAGEIWWIDGPEEKALCEAEQETRLSRDAWEDIISDWLATHASPYYTAAQILQDALGIDAAHIQRVHQNRLSPIMKALGWGKGRKDIGGKRVNVYTRPEADLVAQAEDVPW